MKEKKRQARQAAEDTFVKPKERTLDNCMLRNCSDKMINKFAAISLEFEKNEDFDQCGTPCRDHLDRVHALLDQARRTGLTKPMLDEVRDIKDKLSEMMYASYAEKRNLEVPPKVQQAEKKADMSYFQKKRELKVVGDLHPACRKLHYASLLDEDGTLAKIRKKYEKRISTEPDGPKLNELIIRRDEELDSVPVNHKKNMCYFKHDDYSRKFGELLRATVKHVEAMREAAEKNDIRSDAFSRVVDEAKELVKTYKHDLPLEAKLQKRRAFKRLETDMADLTEMMWNKGI